MPVALRRLGLVILSIRFKRSLPLLAAESILPHLIQLLPEGIGVLVKWRDITRTSERKYFCFAQSCIQPLEVLILFNSIPSDLCVFALQLSLKYLGVFFQFFVLFLPVLADLLDLLVDILDEVFSWFRFLLIYSIQVVSQ